MDKQVRCPVCREHFDLDAGLEAGDTLNCQVCFADLKLTRFDPPEVEEVVETWSDYEDDEEEEEF